MNSQAIYDWEVIVPAAVKEVLLAPASGGLNAWTISDSAEFQKPRPRVEIIYRHTGESKPRRIISMPDGTKRGSAFTGELRLMAISDADSPGKAVHSQYRALIRALLAGLQDSINGSALPFHKIQWLEPGNEDTGIRPQDNLQQTTFPFQVTISIQQDVWSQLII